MYERFVIDMWVLYYYTYGLNWTQSNLTDNVEFAINGNNLWLAGGYDDTYYSSDGKSQL